MAKAKKTSWSPERLAKFRATNAAKKSRVLPGNEEEPVWHRDTQSIPLDAVPERTVRFMAGRKAKKVTTSDKDKLRMVVTKLLALTAEVINLID